MAQIAERWLGREREKWRNTYEADDNEAWFIRTVLWLSVHLQLSMSLFDLDRETGQLSDKPRERMLV